MCGIIGYVGSRECKPLLLGGLERLEYRGYDSAGIALLEADGLRYVRARSHKFFVSFITWVSLLCVCLGVTALIVILSVMNGLEGELRERLLSLSSHARVFVTPGGAAPDWSSLANTLRSAPGVTDVSPFVEVEALAVRKPDMMSVRLRGIDAWPCFHWRKLKTALVYHIVVCRPDGVMEDPSRVLGMGWDEAWKAVLSFPKLKVG